MFVNTWTVTLQFTVPFIEDYIVAVNFIDNNGNLLLNNSSNFATSHVNGENSTLFTFFCDGFNMSWSGTCNFIYNGHVYSSFQFAPTPVAPSPAYKPLFPVIKT